jgi:hypothetical protein
MAEYLKLLKDGDTIYSTIQHVSQSGMSRHIKFFVIIDNEPRFITYELSVALGYKMKGNCVVVKGCGMDMAFSVIMNLCAKLKLNFVSRTI